MAKRVPADSETAPTSPAPPAAPGQARLLIMRGDEVKAIPIPAGGVVSIGRSERADVPIDDPALSRVHLTFEVKPGGEVRVRDEGSSNGTFVRGARIPAGESVPLAPGEMVDAGSLHVSVLRGGAQHDRPKRVWPHGAFELRLEGECGRVDRGGAALAVAHVALEGDPAISGQVIEGILALETGPDDVLGIYAPSRWEVLLAGADDGSAAKWAERVRAALAKSRVVARVGIALSPRDGRTPEALLAHAEKASREEPKAAARDPRAPVIEDPAMREVYRFLDQIAPGEINVLFLGETGVGKEILVEELHRRSRRAKGPLLRLNCGALTESLLESELFGHEKGAFTGAVKAKPGLLESAQGGTIFLDEIGEMPLATQAKLLRVMEERKVRRVGAVDARSIDVRFASATNRDLEREIEAGRFRADLYYRLNGVSVVIPPLRERPAEIAPLARAFAVDAAARNELAVSPDFAPAALALLSSYLWPGNIRELRNVVERAVLLSRGTTIGVEHLPAEKLSSRLVRSPARAAPGPVGGFATATPLARGPSLPPLEDAAKTAERGRILEALDACGGNQTRAAVALGVSRKVLMARLDEYGIPRPKKQ